MIALMRGTSLCHTRTHAAPVLYVEHTLVTAPPAPLQRCPHRAALPSSPAFQAFARV